VVLDSLRGRGGRLLSRVAPRTGAASAQPPASPLSWKTQAMDAIVNLEDEEALAKARHRDR
jgi:hypothetical protein